MYGDKFLEYIENVSKAPARLSKQYIRRMEVQFRDMRNINMMCTLSQLRKI